MLFVRKVVSGASIRPGALVRIVRCSSSIWQSRPCSIGGYSVDDGFGMGLECIVEALGDHDGGGERAKVGQQAQYFVGYVEAHLRVE